MSQLEQFLCLGSVEIANGNRVTTYGAHKLFTPCPCAALEDETYTDPATDDAPWYDADHPESVDFLGFLPESIDLSPAGGRTTSVLADTGAAVGRYKLPGRVLDVRGWMIALDAQAMWWGQRWLVDALKGNPCDEGCAADDLTVLPYCREEGDDSDFRTLMGAGLVDGPRFAPIDADECFVITQAQFQIATSMPWLYLPPTECLDVASANEGLNCELTTPQWVESGTFTIELTNVDTVATTDIVIEGTISLDGSCPIDAPGTSVAPSFRYEIASLGPHDSITIDGARRRILYTDASERKAKAGLGYVSFVGPWRWPDVGYCTTVCLSISASGGDAVASVESRLREV